MGVKVAVGRANEHVKVALDEALKDLTRVAVKDDVPRSIFHGLENCQ